MITRLVDKLQTNTRAYLNFHHHDLVKGINILVAFLITNTLVIAAATFAELGRDASYYVGNLVTILVVFTAKILLDRRGVMASSLYLVGFGWVFTTLLVLFSGGLTSPLLYIYFVVLLLGGLLLNVLGAALALALSIFAALLLAFLETYQRIPAPYFVYGEAVTIIIFGVFLVSAVLVGASVLLMSGMTTKVVSAYDATLLTITTALGKRDGATKKHTERVVELTMAMVKQSEIPSHMWDDVRRGVFLHDIGKIGIPDKILRKRGSFTKSEWEIMKNHPLYAKEIIENAKFLISSLPIPLFHHERWDGSGYPYGLQGEGIPLEARIFAVVDVWDAMTEDRPYRKAFSPKEAMAYIESNSGTHFDPKCVELFLSLDEHLRLPIRNG